MPAFLSNLRSDQSQKNFHQLLWVICCGSFPNLRARPCTLVCFQAWLHYAAESQQLMSGLKGADAPAKASSATARDACKCHSMREDMQ